jgi:hypothetical protein
MENDDEYWSPRYIAQFTEGYGCYVEGQQWYNIGQINLSSESKATGPG